MPAAVAGERLGAVMQLETIVYVILGAAAGGFVNGLAGFGTALMSLGIWLQAMPAEQAVPIVAAMSVISGVQSLWLTRAGLSRGFRRLPRFLLPALVAMPLGTGILVWVDASVIKITIACLMLLYSLFLVMHHALPLMKKDHPVCDALVGLASGLLGGAASLSGVLPTMWAALQPWSKQETSAILRPFNVVILGLACAIYLWRGYFTLETLLMMAIAIPATLIAAQAGVALYKRLSDSAFRRVLLWLMMGAAVSLILREALAAGIG